MKRAPQKSKLVLLSVRVTETERDEFKAAADRVYRPMAQELRRMIRERIEQEREAA